jgi:MOSC domain-containing protein YiiM
MEHVARETLDAGLDEIRSSPADAGTLELIVRRPAENEREVLDAGELDLEQGLVGDRWRGTDPATQLTLINARLLALVAGTTERWPLAGDQLVVDLDLSEDNAPAGTRLAIGETVIEITAEPHTGCAKFSARFGSDALKFINSPTGRALHLRGVNARVVTPGVVRAGDTVTKLQAPRRPMS